MALTQVPASMLSQPLTSGTAQSTASGGSKDFTGIPAWAKRITVAFANVSTNGTSVPMVQLGATSFETSGYASSAAVAAASNSTAATTNASGFLLVSGTQGGNSFSGALTLVLVDPATNTWIASLTAALTSGTGGGFSGGGSFSRVSAAVGSVSFLLCLGVSSGALIRFACLALGAKPVLRPWPRKKLGLSFVLSAPRAGLNHGSGNSRIVTRRQAPTKATAIPAPIRPSRICRHS